jgi:hypothetical protein
MLDCALKTYLLFLLYPVLAAVLLVMSVAALYDFSARFEAPISVKGPWEF